MAQNGPSSSLAREAIGLREVLFQSITHMAPAAAVAFSIIVGANFASGALPLSVVLARRLPSAGGFATYAARGLHRPSASWSAGAMRSWSPWWRRCCSSSSATWWPAP
jgi:hypothetical protein